MQTSKVLSGGSNWGVWIQKGDWWKYIVKKGYIVKLRPNKRENVNFKYIILKLRKETQTFYLQ